MLAKIYIGTLAAIIWVAAIVGKHFWADLDISNIVLACSNVLTGLGVYHVAGPGEALPMIDVKTADGMNAARASGMGQGGFALVPFMALLAALAMLGGCASIENAGHASYTVTSVKGSDGPAYELAVKDGKEYAGRQIQFQTVGGAATLTITEGASKAFAGQALAVKALTVLPVTGLKDLVTP